MSISQSIFQQKTQDKFLNGIFHFHNEKTPRTFCVLASRKQHSQDANHDVHKILSNPYTSNNPIIQKPPSPMPKLEQVKPRAHVR